MSTNAAKLRSSTVEGTDEAQHLKSKVDEMNSSTSENGVGLERAMEVFNQQLESERLKREEALLSKNDAEENFDNVQNQVQQGVDDLKLSLNTKDSEIILAGRKLCGKITEGKELIAKQSVIEQKFRDDVQEKNIKISNLLEYSVKLEKELKNTLRSLSTAKQSSSKKHDFIRSLNATVYQLKHELREVKEEIAHLEGQLRFFTDHRDEMLSWSSSDDQQNDHNEYLKRKLLIELKQAVVNKVRSSRNGTGNNI